MSGMATYCAVGLLAMSRNIWRHSLNRRSWEASHNLCAGSQVSWSGNHAILGHLKAVSVSFWRITAFFFFSRESYHHTKENPMQSVVSWSLDFGLLLLPCKRLFSAGRGKLNGAPSYEQITGTGTSIFRLQNKYKHKFAHVVFPKLFFFSILDFWLETVFDLFVLFFWHGIAILSFF